MATGPLIKVSVQSWGGKTFRHTLGENNFRRQTLTLKLSIQKEELQAASAAQVLEWGTIWDLVVRGQMNPLSTNTLRGRSEILWKIVMVDLISTWTHENRHKHACTCFCWHLSAWLHNTIYVQRCKVASVDDFMEGWSRKLLANSADHTVCFLCCRVQSEEARPEATQASESLVQSVHWWCLHLGQLLDPVMGSSELSSNTASLAWTPQKCFSLQVGHVVNSWMQSIEFWLYVEE